MEGMRFRFKFTVLELLGFATFIAVACVALANATAFVAQLCVIAEIVLLLLAVAVIPGSAGPTRRFLIAFVVGATVFKINSSDHYNWAFEPLAERAWLAIAQFNANPPPNDALESPRTDELVAFRDISRVLLALFLGAVTGLIARSIKPTEQKSSPP